MEAVVVCLALRPPRPCQPERSLKFHKAECERQRPVRCAVRAVHAFPLKALWETMAHTGVGSFGCTSGACVCIACIAVVFWVLE